MNKLNFLSYNANGLGLSKKRIKLFEYLKKKISYNDIIFLQEHTPPKINLLNGKITLQGKYFFHTEQQILVLL